MEKLASAFGAKSKLSEIIKEVPAGAFSMQRLPIEPEIPNDVLEEMSEHRLPAALGTAAAMGIALKPREFQRVVLVRMGQRNLADDLDANNQVFNQSAEFEPSGLDFDVIIRKIAALLSQLVHARSYYSPHLPLRMRGHNIAPERNFLLPTPTPVEHSLLDKVSAAYNGYRRNILMKLSQAKEAVLSDPKLRETVLGENLGIMFSKTSSSSDIITLDSVGYLMGAHLSGGLLSTAAIAEAIATNNPELLTEHLA